MPKVWQKYGKSGSLLGVWEISESTEEMMRALHVEPLPDYRNENRMRQYLGSRVLLQDLLQELSLENVQLLKRESGQPYLSVPDWKLSISHADRFAAVALSRNEVGIDIEKVSPRVKRIQQKFMNEAELACLQHEDDLHWMHIVWSAKEALFKYHPEKDFDFKSHLFVQPEQEGRLRAEIHRSEIPEQLFVEYELIEEFVLAWTES